MECALGIRPHTGWAVAVAVGGPPDGPVVVARAQLELVDDDLPGQVFHAAAELSPLAADLLVGRVARSAHARASSELGRLLDGLRAEGHTVRAMAIGAEPREVPGETQRIVANHALIHSAEGELYRDALERAADWHDLPLLQVDAKKVSTEVADHLHLDPERQKTVLAAAGRDLGPPWRADHKQATLLALLALTQVGARVRTGT